MYDFNSLKATSIVFQFLQEYVMIYTIKILLEITEYSTHNFFFFKHSWILFNEEYVPMSVVDFSLKPNCSFVSILFSIKKQFNLFYIIFNNFLEGK